MTIEPDGTTAMASIWKYCEVSSLRYPLWRPLSQALAGFFELPGRIRPSMGFFESRDAQQDGVVAVGVNGRVLCLQP